jgi:LemA protein
MTVGYTGVGLAVAFTAWLAFAFNGLVKARARVNESWSGVDVQLKRRHDLIPQLVETVAAYASHEHAVLVAVDRAYESASTSSGRRGRQAAEQDLSTTAADARALGERYPELRASEPFRRLEMQLAEVEGEIQSSRRIYNSNVQVFNSRVRGFPGMLIRRLAGCSPIGCFELSPVRRGGTGEAQDAARREAAAA